MVKLSLFQSGLQQARHDSTPGNAPTPTFVDYAMLIGFSGALLIQIGTLLLLGTQILCVPGESLSRILSFVAGCILFVGTALFHLKQHADGSVQTVIGSFLLSLAMLCFAIALLLALVHGEHYTEEHSHDRIHTLQAIALLAALVAVCLMGQKAFQMRRKPWMGHKNYFFYGVCAYGAGCLLLVLTTFKSLGSDALEDFHNGVSVFGALSLATGAQFLSIYSMRSYLNLDAVLEDRYPSTTHMHGATRLHGTAAFVGSLLLLLGRALSVSIRLFVDMERAGPALAAGDAFLGYGALVFACSWNLKLHFRSVSFVGASAVLASGALVRCAAVAGHERAVLDGRPEDHAVLPAIASIVCAVGQAVLVEPFIVRRRKYLMNHFGHPGNYFVWVVATGVVGDLIIACSWFGLGDFRFYGSGRDLGQLGAAIAYLGALLLPLHASMVCEVLAISNFEQYHYEESEGWSERPAIPLDVQDLEKRRQTHAEEDARVTEDLETDVLICGGGPCGLTLANELGLVGVKVILVEMRHEVITDARFFIVNCNTMEGFDRLGVADQISGKWAVPQDMAFGALWTDGMSHPNARIIAASNVPGRDSLRGEMPTMNKTTASRSLCSRHALLPPQRIMQAGQEQVLKEAAEAKETVTLMYGKHLDNFCEMGEGEHGYIRAIVSPAPRGSEEPPSAPPLLRIKAKYLAGCDGPGGPVARSMGFKYDGFANLTNTRSFLLHSPELTRVVRSTLGDTNQYQITRKGVGVGMLVHSDPNRGLWNFIGNWLFDPKKHSGGAQNLIKEFAGPVDFTVLGEKHWYWNFFIAQCWRRGRVVIAGDAAHSWPPPCAINGNTGFGDASNLGWKLAAVVNGWGGDKLLESYSQERRNYCLRVAQMVLGCTPRPRMMLLLCKIWTILDKWCPLLVAPLCWRWMFSNSGIHTGNHHCSEGAQLGQRSDLSPICMTEEIIAPDDPFVQYKPQMAAGGRLPLLPLADGTPIFRVLALEGFTLLVLVDSSGSARRSKAARESRQASAPQQQSPASKLTKSYSSIGDDNNIVLQVGYLMDAFQSLGIPLKVLRLGQDGFDFDRSKFRGVEKATHRVYRHTALSLVRPDRIVAWHLEKRDYRKPFDESHATHIAKTVSGRLDAGEYAKKNVRIRTQLRWLTSRFLFSLRPYGFIFPQALRLKAMSKEEATAQLRKHKEEHFQAGTTKVDVKQAPADQEAATAASEPKTPEAEVATERSADDEEVGETSI